MPVIVNMHSVKNRFLMRIKNITADLYLRHFAAIMLRDLLVIGGCLLRETGSLRAFTSVARLYPKMRRRREEIMRKRCVDSAYMAAWFRTKVAPPR